ncbi:MAG: ECF-type sigma factor, partial [Planctomyces sp.]
AMQNHCVESESGMSSLTGILQQVEICAPGAEDVLLQAVYQQLRRLAAARMRCESPANTLQPTALVHEAWMRVLATRQGGAFRDRRSFFAAFSVTMRRVLIDVARRRNRECHGGGVRPLSLSDQQTFQVSRNGATSEMLLVHEALERLDAVDSEAAELVSLHYFAGLPLTEVAEVLGISRATSYRVWQFARVWLRAEIERLSN